MENYIKEEWLLSMAIAFVVLIVILYRLYNRDSSKKAIDQLINEYYQQHKIQVISISPLTVADKLKYGVPLNPIVSLYSSPLKFLTALHENYHRMLETEDASGKEHIRYIEIRITTSKGFTVNEFDTYEF